MTHNQSALRIDRRGDVAILIMDVPGESMNTLKEDFTQEFAEAFSHLEKDASVKAVVFASGKKDSFIAGANIDMLEACKSAADAEKLSRDGQRAMDRIAAFPKPVVAAIHGACLGGGLEVALACHARIASDSSKTKLGLPESQLGLLPGAGGTQRLPALIGVQASLDLLLTGKQVDGKKAKKLGFVDEVVPASILLDVAVKHAQKLVADGHPKKSPSFFEQLGDKDALAEMALAHNPLGRKVVFGEARKALRKKTRGNYPAQERILDVVKVGLEKGLEGGLDAEAKAFGELVMSPESKALRSIFFATQALKKDNGTNDPDAKPRKITHVGMLGAGLMGAGIAYVTTSQGKTPVRLKDRDAKGILAGLKYVREIIDDRVKKKRMNRMDADQLMTLTTGTTDYSGFAACEELGKKHGKTVIVVNDGPGFYTTRILAPLMNEAAHLLAEGVAIESIDRAMLDFGFPVGPIKLTDEVGIDVGAKVGKVMLEAFGDRMAAPAGMEKLIADDRKGRKNGKGFYLYGGDKKGVDESVYEVLGVKPDNTSVSAEDVAWRCTLQMVNEAALCFQEGILRSARDGDIGAIFGLGFPPFRGGPFRFVDSVGAKEIVRRLRHYEQTVGKRFSPAPLLVAMADKGLHFHEGTTVSPGQMPS